MDDKIARRPMVDARGVESDCFHPSLFDEKLGNLFRQAGKMKIRDVAGLLGTEVTLAVAPILPPAGARQHNRAWRYPSMNLFPSAQVFDL